MRLDDRDTWSSYANDGAPPDFVMRTAARKETAVHKAADAHVKKMATAIRYAFARGRKALKGKMNPSTTPRDVAAIVKQALLDVMPDTLRATLADGGNAGLSLLKKARAAEITTAAGPLKFRFSDQNPHAVAWAKEHAAEMATNISETTREAIRAAIESALEQGDLAGATDDIAAAVGDEDRAVRIARNETMTAANEGQRQAWDQAVEEGLLTGDERRVWIATDDSLVCPICDALDGEVADLDGEYPGDGGDGPPAHPLCRCTEGIV